MDPSNHFQAIWQRKWLVLGLSLLVAVIVYFWSAQQTKVYVSTATVDTLAGATEGGNAPSLDTADIITSRNAALIGTTSLQRDAILASGLDISTTTAAQRLSTDATGSPGYLGIRATGPSPEDARDLARGAAAALIDRNEGSGNNVKQVSPASLPGGPVSPRPARDAMLAFLIALIVNAELAALAGQFAGRLDAPGRSAELTRAGAPVITRLPQRKQREAVEAFWELRAAIDLAAEPIHSVAIVEQSRNSDGTLLAIGLAQATANAKIPVTLVDANLRHPTIGAALGLDEEGGLRDALRGHTVKELLRPGNQLQAHYRILIAGGTESDPPGRLGAGAFERLVEQLRTTPNASVIALTPPTSAGIDAMVVAAQCDAVVLVLHARRSSSRDAAALVDRFVSLGVPVLGSVITYARLARTERSRLATRTS